MVDNEYVENWILIAASDYTLPSGIPIHHLYYQRPDKIKELRYDKFYRTIFKLLDQKLLERPVRVIGNVRITKEGIKEIKKKIASFRRQESAKYLELISISPMFELRERITNLEQLVYNSILMMLVGYLSYTAFQADYKIKIMLAIITVIFSIKFSFNLTTLAIFAGPQYSKDDLIKGIVKFTDKYAGIIFTVIFIGALSFVSWLLNRFGKLPWNIIICTLILGVIVLAIDRFFNLKRLSIEGWNKVKQKWRHYLK